MASCFTVAPGGRATTGINLEDGTVILGETGRSRRRVTVTPPPGSTIEGNFLMDVPLNHVTPGAVALLIKDQSGYRGSWSLRAARPVAWYQLWARVTAEHTADGVHYDPSRLGWEAGPAGHVAIGDCPACAAVFGPARAALPTARPGRVIAEGQCAQGDAGAMGGGSEYLYLLPAGESVEIARSGRLYGSPAVTRITNRGGTVESVDPVQEATDVAASAAW